MATTLEIVKDLAISCLNNEAYLFHITAGIDQGDSEALGVKVGQFYNAICNEVKKVLPKFQDIAG